MVPYLFNRPIFAFEGLVRAHVKEDPRIQPSVMKVWAHMARPVKIQLLKVLQLDKLLEHLPVGFNVLH